MLETSIFLHTTFLAVIFVKKNFVNKRLIVKPSSYELIAVSWNTVGTVERNNIVGTGYSDPVFAPVTSVPDL